MPKDKTTPPPRRKEPGIIGKSVSWIAAMVFWLLASLIISIAIEWIGIAVFWKDQGSQHSRIMLEKDMGYLNERVIDSANRIVRVITKTTYDINRWVVNEFGLGAYVNGPKTHHLENTSLFHAWLQSIYATYTPYIDAIPNTIQTFFVRLAIIVLSLPAFLLFAVIGMVDGLVERDLRRWGGGRESSVVYNLARKSIVRFFVLACVCYLSLPIAIAPAWVIMPFALAFGLSIRISFERFKKYF